MRKLLRILFWFGVVNVALMVAARVAKLFIPSHGDETSERFDLVTIMDGTEFAAVSGGFDAASAVTIFGGLDLDLTGATPVPEGARLSLLTVLGGVRLALPSGWRVVMRDRIVAGEHDADIPDPTSMPEDAPSLTIDARTYFGGVQVVTGP